MTTEFETHEFWRQFDTEARRIRLNMIRMPVAVATRVDWQVPLLDRMRALEPGATWQDVFSGAQLPAPDPDLAGASATFDADPEAWWREHDLSQQVLQEFERLVLFPREATSLDAQAFGWSLPEDAESALRRLRSLPDGAGWKAFRNALHDDGANDK